MDFIEALEMLRKNKKRTIARIGWSKYQKPVGLADSFFVSANDLLTKDDWYVIEPILQKNMSIIEAISLSKKTKVRVKRSIWPDSQYIQHVHDLLAISECEFNMFNPNGYVPTGNDILASDWEEMP